LLRLFQAAGSATLRADDTCPAPGSAARDAAVRDANNPTGA
jgi:hypothetical protein